MTTAEARLHMERRELSVVYEPAGGKPEYGEITNVNDHYVFVRYEGGDIPLPEGGFDLIFSSCVFHHIEADEHVGLFAQLRKRLAPGGRMAIFEHNPVNPVTRYIVATCPFDENAVLIPAPVFAARQRAAGFAKVSAAFTGFFPGSLKALRPLERYMTALPLGAQYYTLAQG